VNTGATLDAPAARRWVTTAQAALRARRIDIDAMNVFPIADSDTGTNLLLTWESAAAALPPVDPADRLGDLLAVLARGALLGARGNSGVILCQLLRGFAAALPQDKADARAVAGALSRSAEEAAAAVSRPVQGTILSVATAAAAAALLAAGEAGGDAPGSAGGDAIAIVEVLRAAERAATSALARTPDQLPVLAEAGVVDAGGSGWLVILASLRLALESDAVPDLEPLADVLAHVGAARPNGHLPQLHADVDSDGFGYEVQYLLSADADSVRALRSELEAIGGSLVIVGGEDLWQVHIHVDDAGAALEAGVRAGIPSRITVTRFSEQDDAAGDAVDAAGGAAGVAGLHRRATDLPTSRSLVAVATGVGFQRLFESAGATTMLSEAPTQEEIEHLVIGTGTNEVVVIPDSARSTQVAQRAAEAIRRRSGTNVVVVPTISPVQGLAALAVADPSARLADALVAMAEAAGATRVAEVVVAAQRAMTNVGTCEPGDALAMVGGDVVLIGTIEAVAVGLLDRLLDGGGELVTLITGEQTPPGLADRLVAHLDATHPLAEVTVYDGGQPRFPLLVGVE
jgi:DAK2 domain fusion protein YloV